MAMILFPHSLHQGRGSPTSKPLALWTLPIVPRPQDPVELENLTTLVLMAIELQRKEPGGQSRASE